MNIAHHQPEKALENSGTAYWLSSPNVTDTWY